MRTAFGRTFYWNIPSKDKSPLPGGSEQRPPVVPEIKTSSTPESHISGSQPFKRQGMAKTSCAQKPTDKELPPSAVLETKLHMEESPQSPVKQRGNISSATVSPEGMSWAYPKCLTGTELRNEVTTQPEEEKSSNVSVSASQSSPSPPQNLHSVKSVSPTSSESPHNTSSTESEHFNVCHSPTESSVKNSCLPKQIIDSEPTDKMACDLQVEIANFLTPSADFLEQIMDNVSADVKATTTGAKACQQQETDASLLALSTTFGMLVDDGMHLLRKTMDNVHSSVQSGNKQMHTDMVHLHNVIQMGWVQLAEQMSTLIKVLTTLVHNQQPSSTLLHNVALQRTIAISEGHFTDYLRCDSIPTIAEETLSPTCYVTEETLINASSENPAASSTNSETYK
ncbi:uncharacterized protein LOC144495220 [Mustelus asterias]